MFRQFIRQQVLPGCAKLGVQYHPREIGKPQAKGLCNSKQPLPKISVVIPSFNQARYLRQTILSVLGQDYPNLEIIVVDGGSQDGSVDIIKEFEQQILWWVSEADNGQVHAINKGFMRASGDVLAWLNSDDIFLPGALHTIAACFVSNPQVDIVYGQRLIIDAQGFEIGKWILPNHDKEVLRYADFIPQETLFWRKKAWEKVGGKLDENFQFALDWDLILRFSDLNLRFLVLNRFLGGFRFHSQQKTVAEIASNGLAEMEILRQRVSLRQTGDANYSKHKMRFWLIIFLAKARLKEVFYVLGFLKID